MQKNKDVLGLKDRLGKAESQKEDFLKKLTETETAKKEL